MLGLLKRVEDQRQRALWAAMEAGKELHDIFYEQGPAPGQQKPRSYQAWVDDFEQRADRIWELILENGLEDEVAKLLKEQGIGQ